jgi:hypothetical protein
MADQSKHSIGEKFSTFYHIHLLNNVEMLNSIPSKVLV